MGRPLRILIDVALVVAFAALGRMSHQEPLTLEGLTRTAAPFVGALLLAWVFLILSRRASGQVAPLREGLTVWLITVALGMIFRLMVGDGLAPAFVAVATAVLAAFLVGWRALWWLATRNRRPAARRVAKDAARSGNPAVRDRARRKR